MGIYAQRLLDDPLPWTRMRQVYRLLALAQRYGEGPVNTACGRALALDVINVTMIASMLERASENTPTPLPPRPATIGAARFARDPSEFTPHRPALILINGGRPGDGQDKRDRPGFGRPQGAAAGPEARQAARHPARAAITLAKQQHLPHADFLELVLADEVTRRETNSAALRARATGLDPGMRLDTWDTTAAVRYDQQLWAELTTLRFLDGPHGALLLGLAGTG